MAQAFTDLNGTKPRAMTPEIGVTAVTLPPDGKYFWATYRLDTPLPGPMAENRWTRVNSNERLAGWDAECSEVFVYNGRRNSG
jgi:hypothetical protein